jgi:surface carbohydrate biosynthesis protein
VNSIGGPARPVGQPLRGKRIALIVDHPQRDLSGLVLLAFELCQRGAVCHLVPLNLEEREIMSLAPDFVLLNYFRTFNYRLGKWMDGARITFGLQDTEGGAWPTIDTYTRILWQDRALLRKARGVCTWGGVLAKHLIREGLLEASQVTVTGCARFDLYAKGWRGVIVDADDADCKRPGHVLINTNYSLGNPRFTTRAENIEYCHKEYGIPYETLVRRAGVEHVAIQETIGMAVRLATDYPERQIILRPHPFEDPEPYRRALRTHGNVTFGDRGAVHPLICGAAAVIQRSCTTAIESVAAGVAALSPQWIPAPALVPVAEAVSIPVESYPALRKSLDEIMTGTYQPTPEQQSTIASAISDWFYRFDGWSHRRIADVITASAATWPSPDAPLCRRLAYGLKAGERGLIQKASSAARYLLGLSPDFSFRRLSNVPTDSWTYTAKHLDLGEVRSLLGRIEAAARSGGDECGSVYVGLTRDRGDYQVNYFGHALTLTLDGTENKSDST